MIVTCVHVYVKDDHIEDFIAATALNHRASVAELGNFRFDILQELENPGRFLLYEAYQSAEQAAAHKQTQHYLTWRATVAEWMAQPRRGVGYRMLFPEG